MKKLFSIFALGCLMAACNSGSSTTSTDTSAAMSTDTTSMSTDTSSMAATDTSSATSTTMKDGVMTMKDGKMMVMQGGTWTAMTEDVTCTNGVKVKKDGEISKGSKKKKLAEGEMIDKDGQLTDANGKLVDNAGW